MEKVKYDFERRTIVPGYYSLHRPSKCNLKFPKDNRPIHKKARSAYDGKQTVEITQNGKIRRLLIPGKDKLIYPAIWPKSAFEKLKQQAEDIELQLNTAEKAAEKLKHQSELCQKRIEKLRALQKPQPNQQRDLEGKLNDEKIELLKKSSELRAENFQGARKANQVIMASKCHAIRDAQIIEKQIIKRALENENTRLDQMMEQVRLLELEKEQKKYEEKKAQRLTNINYIKDQISENEKRKIAELELKQRESALINQTSIIAKTEEAVKLNKKNEDARKLKELLDKGKEDYKLYKQKREMEMKAMESRMKKFLQERQEREKNIKLEENAKKISREKNIENISKAQKAEKELLEKLENNRLLKIQEDVERQCREREKLAAIKKKNELKMLQEARDKQIEDIRRQIAFEASRDEDVQRRLLQKEKEEIQALNRKEKIKEETLKEFQQLIRKQISEKEQIKNELRKTYLNEGNELKQKFEEEDRLERLVVKQKIQEMKAQKIPIKYVNEAERSLLKLKYI